MQLQRSAEVRSELVVLRDESRAARGRGQGPVAPRRLRLPLEDLELAPRVVVPSCPRVGLDQVRRPLDDGRLLEPTLSDQLRQLFHERNRLLAVTLTEGEEPERRQAVRDDRADPLRRDLERLSGMCLAI